MDDKSLEEKLQQFHAFFTIEHQLKVNMLPLSESFELPSQDTLTEHMPYAFRIAGEMSALESQALRPLRNLGGHAHDLVDFLNHQSRKIDLLMSYILQQQDDQSARYVSVSFGGGGVTIVSDQPVATGTRAELKLFLLEESAAVFCYGEVIACHEEQGKYHIALIFTRILEQDQELLVRASLHLQTQQLRAKHKQNSNESG